jgi:GNAT superfamily N-acetyltransferase
MGAAMSVSIRPIALSDTDVCGRICYQGYKELYDLHGFPPAFPSVEAAQRRIKSMAEHPSVFGVVGEINGSIAGFNFLTEADPVRAVGPLVVDPAAQGKGAGRQLMNAVMERANGAPSVRLVTAAYNFQSLPLYTSMGFEVKEPLLSMVGRPERAQRLSGYNVRAMVKADVPGCRALHERVHGFSRANELLERLEAGTVMVAVRDGKICSYLTSPKAIIENHGVAETTEAMMALLIGASEMVDGPISLLMPIRQGELFRWCLQSGFRLVNAMVLMNVGNYSEPQGAFVPSILY